MNNILPYRNKQPRLGQEVFVAPGALLTEGLRVPPGSLVYESPAKVVSSLDGRERAQIRRWAEKYCRVAADYRAATGF